MIKSNVVQSLTLLEVETVSPTVSRNDPDSWSETALVCLIFFCARVDLGIASRGFFTFIVFMCFIKFILLFADVTQWGPLCPSRTEIRIFTGTPRPRTGTTRGRIAVGNRFRTCSSPSKRDGSICKAHLEDLLRSSVPGCVLKVSQKWSQSSKFPLLTTLDCLCLFVFYELL